MDDAREAMKKFRGFLRNVDQNVDQVAISEK